MFRSIPQCSTLAMGFLLAAALTAAPAHATLITGGFNIDGGDPVTASAVPPATPGNYNGSSGAVTNINDGQASTDWIPNYGGTLASPIIATIDLGRDYRLTDLNLTNSLFAQRATDGYNVTASTTGAFAGEQVTLVSGNMPTPAAGDTDIAIAANQVGRYIRFTGTSVPAGDFNGGLAELSLGGVPNRAVAQLQPIAPAFNSISAQAFTRTVNQTDAAATWSLYAITPTSSTMVQSVGKSVTTSTIDYGSAGNITDGVNDSAANEVLFSQTPQPDLSHGDATVNLGQRMIINQLSLRNSSNNGNGTKDYLVFVANNLSDFDDPNYTEVISAHFSVVNEVDTFTLSAPIIGQYVRFVALDPLDPVTNNRAGLDELTVTGQTFTTTLLASGSSAVGDSSNIGNIGLAGNLPGGFNLLALDANTSDGLNRETLQEVFVPEPASLSMLAVAGLFITRRRRA